MNNYRINFASRHNFASSEMRNRQQKIKITFKFKRHECNEKQSTINWKRR